MKNPHPKFSRSWFTFNAWAKQRGIKVDETEEMPDWMKVLLGVIILVCIIGYVILS